MACYAQSATAHFAPSQDFISLQLLLGNVSSATLGRDCGVCSTVGVALLLARVEKSSKLRFFAPTLKVTDGDPV